MVRQLLTVTRLESGALQAHERGRVARRRGSARRGRRSASTTWVRRSTTAAEGWLAVADADQLDQVLWALLDNAVKYGGRLAGRGVVAVEAEAERAASDDHAMAGRGSLDDGP